MLIVVGSQVVEVVSDKLLLSEYFSGLIDTFDDQQLIPFPPTYKSVFGIYLSYLNDDKVVIIDSNGDKIKSSIELAHYLLDDNFFEFLIPHLLKLGEAKKKSIIDSLANNIQWSLSLYLPLFLVPNKSRHNYKFVCTWLNKNSARIAMGVGIPYLINTNYVNDRLSSIECVMVVKRKIVKHGVCQQWICATDDSSHHNLDISSNNNNNNNNNDMYIISEHNYRYDKQVGCQYDWHNNGVLCQKSYIHVNDRDTNSDYCKRYYDNGQIMLENYYQNNIRSGTWKYWYQSGNLKYEISYYSGAKHGSHLGYYDMSTSHVMLNTNLTIDSDTISDTSSNTNLDTSSDTSLVLEFEYNFHHGKEIGTFRSWWPPTGGSDGKQQLKYEHMFPTSGLKKQEHKQWNESGGLVYQTSSPHVDLLPRSLTKRRKYFGIPPRSNYDGHRNFMCNDKECIRYDLV